MGRARRCWASRTHRGPRPAGRQFWQFSFSLLGADTGRGRYRRRQRRTPTITSPTLGYPTAARIISSLGCIAFEPDLSARRPFQADSIGASSPQHDREPAPSSARPSAPNARPERVRLRRRRPDMTGHAHARTLGGRRPPRRARMRGALRAEHARRVRRPRLTRPSIHPSPAQAPEEVAAARGPCRRCKRRLAAGARSSGSTCCGAAAGMAAAAGGAAGARRRGA